MVYSMTGYGRCEVEENCRKVIVEISSINHRYCDFNIKMPRTLIHLEEVIKASLKEQITRGKLEVSIYCHSTAEEDIEVVINEPICKGYIEGLRSLGDRFHLEDDLKLSHLIKLNDLFTLQKKAGDADAIAAIIHKALAAALAELMQMRAREGKALKEDILGKLEKIYALTKAIEERSGLVVDEYKKKLEARLAILLGDVTLDPSRIATEVAVLADKCAIDEELIRLKSHTAQIIDILEEDNAMGRKLDFLMQEMNREANTIGSKANDYSTTKCVVELKNEIEKIREQVQNIE